MRCAENHYSILQLQIHSNQLLKFTTHTHLWFCFTDSSQFFVIYYYLTPVYLSVVSGTSPIYDELCLRFLNFIATHRSSDSELTRSVIKHAILCVQVQSPVGHNYVLCYERYGFKVEDDFRSDLKSSCCSSEVSMQLSFIDCCQHYFRFATD